MIMIGGHTLNAVPIGLSILPIMTHNLRSVYFDACQFLNLFLNKLVSHFKMKKTNNRLIPEQVGFSLWNEKNRW